MTLQCLNAHIVPSSLELTNDAVRLLIYRAANLLVQFIYFKTNSLRAIQLLLGHAKLESTIEYLGVEIEDALAISENCET